jgi:hypothetical protein
VKPLQAVAMGLVVITLSARFAGYDALPDPLGWLLVWVGVRTLPEHVGHRATLLRLAVLSGLVSVVLWFPAVPEDLYTADASLGWTANLPQLLFTGLLCHALAGRAAEATDVRATRWLRLTRSGVVAVALLPVLVFGAGLASFETTSYLAAGLLNVVLVVELFRYAPRPWADGGADAGSSADVRQGPPSSRRNDP